MWYNSNNYPTFKHFVPYVTYTMSEDPSLIACHACDLLLKKPVTSPGKKLICPRCKSTLYHKKIDSVNKVMAISFSGLLLYYPAIFAPLLTLSSAGMTQKGSVFDAFLSFYHQEYYFVAVILFLTSIFFPLFKLSLLLSITIQIKLQIYSRSLPFLFRTANSLDEWSMPDVYLIAILVSIIKISGIATIHYNLGFVSFVFLTIMTRATASAIDSELFWQKVFQLKKSVKGVPANG